MTDVADVVVVGGGIAGASLAYALAAGVPHAVLAYPGLRSGRRELVLGGGRVRVTLFRLRLAGTDAACRRSITRLARVVRARR